MPHNLLRFQRMLSSPFRTLDPRQSGGYYFRPASFAESLGQIEKLDRPPSGLAGAMARSRKNPAREVMSDVPIGTLVTGASFRR